MIFMEIKMLRFLNIGVAVTINGIMAQSGISGEMITSLNIHTLQITEVFGTLDMKLIMVLE